MRYRTLGLTPTSYSSGPGWLTYGVYGRAMVAILPLLRITMKVGPPGCYY